MKINSIFKSINGEINAFHQGSICTFIRFAGCPLTCRYCDTAYAQNFSSGKEMTLSQIMDEVENLKCKTITITGGEPLAQKLDCFELVRTLVHNGYRISIETNGSFEIEKTWPVSWVVDYKSLSSGMRDEMLLENYEKLNASDFLKIVIANKDDFLDAGLLIKTFVNIETPIAFSPMFLDNVPMVEIQTLIDWVAKANFNSHRNIVVNIQIHKLLNIA